MYSHTLFYFCLQFEFYSLSFLMFFSLKNLNQAIQSIAIFCEKFSEHYKSALHYVPDSMHNCVVFFVNHTRYWIDITIQKYEVYARWNVAAKCFKICHFLCTYIYWKRKKYGFTIVLQTIANFKAFHKNISLSSNLLLQKSKIYTSFHIHRT